MLGISICLISFIIPITHSAMKALPVDVFDWKAGSYYYQAIHPVSIKFREGDEVRIMIHKTAFTKWDVKNLSGQV